jgi:integrase
MLFLLNDAFYAVRQAGITGHLSFPIGALTPFRSLYRACPHGAGKIQARYSVHDLRHAFVVRLYPATHDVSQVEKALGHANVAVTETFLRSLGVVGE